MKRYLPEICLGVCLLVITFTVLFVREEGKRLRETQWLESEMYVLEDGGKRYQTGLRKDGTVVWREVEEDAK